MADGWEKPFGGRPIELAVLHGYKRSFCKLSEKNWGTPKAPGPTLGLVESAGAKCIGVAFEFLDDHRDSILAYLQKREGNSFSLHELPIILPTAIGVRATVPVNKPGARTFVGYRPIEERAAMARIAAGTKGTCVEYVRQARTSLAAMGIADAEVDEFLHAVEAPQ